MLSKTDLQRCWIITILMLMFSLQTHSIMLEFPLPPDKNDVPAVMWLGIVSGWAGFLMTVFMVCATVDFFRPKAKRFWREFKKDFDDYRADREDSQ